MQLHLISCPDLSCGVPAEVIDRFALSSTDGPIEYLRTYCVGKHIFTVPAERVAQRFACEPDRAASTFPPA